MNNEEHFGVLALKKSVIVQWNYGMRGNGQMDVRNLEIEGRVYYECRNGVNGN